MSKILFPAVIVLLVFTIVTSAAPQYFIFKDFNSVFSGNVRTGFGSSDDNDQSSSNAIGSADNQGEFQGILPIWRAPTIDYEKIAEMIDEKIEKELKKLNLTDDGSNVINNSSNSDKSKETAFNEDRATWYKATNGYWYKVFTERSGYSDAMKMCEKYGAKLAHVGVRNKAMQPELLQLVRNSGYTTFIGLDDTQNEGTFVWADGTPHQNNEINWNSSQPDNGNGVQDCAVYASFFGWRFDDLDCTTKANFVCEHMP